MATVPLENVTVTAFRWNNDSSSYSNERSTTTDAAGEYELTGLKPGASYAFKFSDNNEVYLTIYFGIAGFKNTLDETSAYQITEAGLTLNATLVKGAIVSGLVEGDDGT